MTDIKIFLKKKKKKKQKNNMVVNDKKVYQKMKENLVSCLRINTF